MKKPQGLSNFQITAVVTQSIIGLIMLGIARRAASMAGIDGVFVTLITGVLSAAVAAVMILLGNRFPNQTVIEFSQEILGKFLGRLFGAFFVFYTMLVTAVTVRGFADALIMLLLPKTPIEFVMITMLILCSYCVAGGISSVARINEIFLPPVIIVISLVILMNIGDVDLFRYRAVFSNGIKPILSGIAEISTAYLGYEILFFLSPVVKNKDKMMPYGLAGIAIPLVLYSGLVFVSIGIDGASATADIIYPTIQLARRISLFGSAVEKFDILFILLWILSIFTTIITFLYMASISVTRLAGLRNYKPFIFMLIPLIYMIAILPANIVDINTVVTLSDYIGTAVVLSCIPMLLLSILRKKGGKKNGS